MHRTSPSPVWPATNKWCRCRDLMISIGWTIMQTMVLMACGLMISLEVNAIWLLTFDCSWTGLINSKGNLDFTEVYNGNATQPYSYTGFYRANKLWGTYGKQRPEGQFLGTFEFTITRNLPASSLLGIQSPTTFTLQDSASTLEEVSFEIREKITFCKVCILHLSFVTSHVGLHLREMHSFQA